MSTYRIITSDGRKHEIQASSAAQAIEEGRWAYPGKTIKEVYSGLTEEDCESLRRIDREARPMVGIINHEVPPHEPIKEGEIRHKPTRRYEDTTVPMFNEEAIRRESEAAKHKRDNS